MVFQNATQTEFLRVRWSGIKRLAQQPTLIKRREFLTDNQLSLDDERK